jgi:glycosyltransferase involved in cell wall biosynthesis
MPITNNIIDYTINPYPKISIVTPNYNQGQFLEETILSVLNQNYLNLEYIIIDGGSTDGSIDIIKKYEGQLKYWISETDTGMYDAIQKGFAKSTGEIMAWINSDDIYMPNAFKTAVHLFNKHKEMQWLTGTCCNINENSLILNNGLFSNTSSLKIKLLRKYPSQEATFWKRDLWFKAGSKLDIQFRYAGDFDLWLRFTKHEKLYSTKSIFSAFRLRKGQLSSFYPLYEEEIEQSFEKNKVSLSFFSKILIIYVLLINKTPGVRNLETVKNHIDRIFSVTTIHV